MGELRNFHGVAKRPVADDMEVVVLNEAFKRLQACQVILRACLDEGIEYTDPLTQLRNRHQVEMAMANVFASIKQLGAYYQLDERRILSLAHLSAITSTL